MAFDPKLPPPTPKKVPLNLFQSKNYPLRDNKKEHEINRQAKQSTLYHFGVLGKASKLVRREIQGSNPHNQIS